MSSAVNRIAGLIGRIENSVRQFAFLSNFIRVVGSVPRKAAGHSAIMFFAKLILDIRLLRGVANADGGRVCSLGSWRDYTYHL
jgi:hypothetical protein